MPSAIDPSQIPGKDIDPGVIGEQATKIAGFAGEIRDQGADVQKQWQGMSAVYSAPESGTVLGLMQPVSSQSTAVGDNLDVVAAALQTFATVVAPIKAELDALRARAEAFGRVIAGGVQVRELNPAWINAQSTYGGASTISYSSPSTGGSTAVADVPQYQTVTRDWHEVAEYVDLNNTLIAEVNAQQVALWDAERECANKIRALYGAAGLRGYQSEHDPLGYGLDEIPEGTEMPWGAPVERTEGCAEATANFVVKDFLWEGILVGGVWGTVTGLGTLVLGYNPETGGFFSGDAYGAAWSSLGMLAAGLALNSGPQTLLFAADDAMEQFGGGGFLPDEVRDFKNSTEEAWLNTGKALIAWDKWEDDPGTALGESVFNVGTLLIPVGGAAVAGVKTASTAASVLSKMARVVDFIDPGAWAVNGALKLANGGFTGLGSLDNLIGKIDDATTNFDTPNIEVYTATDAGSALQILDDWGVDLDTVTARVDANGTNLLEFPGGAVELPAGAFDGAAGGGRIGDEGSSLTAPVREPELVAAGSVRGETGPGPVNTIVDEAPVRTENGVDAGSGSSGGDGSHGAPDGRVTAGAEGGGDGGDSSGGPNGSGGPGKPSMEQQVATLDGAHPVLDTTGRDISSALRSTTMTTDDLAAYLYSTDSSAFDEFIDTGIWPADVQIPKDPQGLAVGVDERFGVDWSQVPQRGYELDQFGNAITAPHTPAIGSVIDRYGPPNGTFTSPVPDSGPYVYDQRSLPFVEDPGHYHTYEVVGDLDNLRPYYDAAPADVKQKIDYAIELGYFTWSKTAMSGPIAPGFGSAGGGMQIELPLPVNRLLELGVLKELP